MCAPSVVVWKLLIVMNYFEDSLLGQSHFPCAPRFVVWKVLIVMKYFEDSLLGQSHFPCDTA
jgi:hypothetical protein